MEDSDYNDIDYELVHQSVRWAFFPHFNNNILDKTIYFTGYTKNKLFYTLTDIINWVFQNYFLSLRRDDRDRGDIYEIIAGHSVQCSGDLCQRDACVL